MNGTVADFYVDPELAEIYAILSRDRNFEAEIDALTEESSMANWSCGLELFAGPAEHSKVLQNLGVEMSAVDNSEAMKTIAIKQGFNNPEQYYINDLSSAKIPRGTYDLICAMRYSIGYLAPIQVKHLVAEVVRSLNPQGIAVFELHNLALLRNEFSDLSIRERSATIGDGTIVRCAWPSKPLEWSEVSWVVNMAVQIESFNPETGYTSQRELISTERIYTAEDIKDYACEAGEVEVVYLDKPDVFTNSKVVLLRKNAKL